MITTLTAGLIMENDHTEDGISQITSSSPANPQDITGEHNCYKEFIMPTHDTKYAALGEKKVKECLTVLLSYCDKNVTLGQGHLSFTSTWYMLRKSTSTL